MLLKVEYNDWKLSWRPQKVVYEMKWAKFMDSLKQLNNAAALRCLAHCLVGLGQLLVGKDHVLIDYRLYKFQKT